MKILLAVDSSAASEAAAKAIAARPWPKDTTIQILSVADTSSAWNAPELEEGLLKSAQEAVSAAADLLKSPAIAATSLVLTGDPKTVVVDYASQTEVDLIVVGSHDESDAMRFLLGSVTRAVVRFAPCSVEIVRPRLNSEAWKVLLATDGSPCSEAAARSIAARPWPAGSEFRVFGVAELSQAWFRIPYPAYFDPKAMEDLRGEAMKRAEDAVMAAEKILADAGLSESANEAVPSASVKELILTEAAQWGADLIVAGSHGRRGASRFLLGSVSEPVAFHATCSVEIVRMPHAG
ncbi:MAG: universal stress protein [Bryobacteraceae bacterium]|jgi:nucleotide-binding universal stress UspA family protein